MSLFLLIECHFEEKAKEIEGKKKTNQDEKKVQSRKQCIGTRFGVPVAWIL